MLTYYHSPQSRSFAVLSLIEEMGIADKMERVIVTIPRQDGSGGPDPRNPHPEKKVPALEHDGTLLTERGAIMLYLTALFPESGLAPKPGTAKRGEYLTWLFWYQGVMEPVILIDFAEVKHPVLDASLRGNKEVIARLHNALEKGPYLLGEEFSAADVLCHSPYAWFPDITPDDPLIRDWVERCKDRPAVKRALEIDAALMKAA